MGRWVSEVVTDWVAKRVAIEGLTSFTDDQAYRAIDFLLEALEEISGEIFGSVAHLLNLDLDIVLVDTTSTYFDVDVPDELADLPQVGNLRVKDVAVAPGGDGDDGARAQRFVVCHNPEQADRDAAVRDQLVTHLEQLMASSDGWTSQRRDEFVGSLRSKSGLRRYLRRTSSGLLRVDAAAIKREPT